MSNRFLKKDFIDENPLAREIRHYLNRGTQMGIGTRLVLNDSAVQGRTVRQTGQRSAPDDVKG